MPRYRRKPKYVEAVQFTEAMARGDEPLPAGVRFGSRELGPPPKRKLLSHRHYAIGGPTHDWLLVVGDWIVTGSRGDVRACNADEFAETWELATQ